MSALRKIFLYPIQAEDDWLFVIVSAPTGVAYANQCGGLACRQQSLEGFLVPLGAFPVLVELRRFFEEHDGCATHTRWTDENRERLRRILAHAIYITGAGVDDQEIPLELDEDRISDVEEAWVPVLTPDGPGVLVWSNSD